MKTHIETMLEEKGIDLDQDLNIEDHIGLSPNIVLEFCYQLPPEVQTKICRTFIQIDFNNGDVLNYLKFLANGIAQGF